MFTIYNKDALKNLRNEWNIFVLVGNGFDIAAINKYNNGIMKGRTTSYKDFFEYMQFFAPKDYSNILFDKMKEDREMGNKDWSDFENTIDILYRNREHNIEELENSIDEFQAYFTQYLNTLVDANLLLKLNKDVKEKKLTNQTLGYFLRDFKPNTIDFASKVKYYDLFNFVFANFNYTSLLDNYVFLDKNQFDPHKYKNADRNFTFYINNCGESKFEFNYSTYVILDTIHPHGMQDIPRSILFGIDLEEYDEGTSIEKRIVKSYWAQYNLKYEPYIGKADLFIIYGMSFGKTDSWWMDKIFDSIKQRKVELLIYKHGNESIDEVKEVFINACVRHKEESYEVKEEIKKYIHVKTFSENNTYFLGFEKLIDGDV